MTGIEERILTNQSRIMTALGLLLVAADMV